MRISLVLFLCAGAACGSAPGGDTDDDPANADSMNARISCTIRRPKNDGSTDTIRKQISGTLKEGSKPVSVKGELTGIAYQIEYQPKSRLAELTARTVKTSGQLATDIELMSQSIDN